MAARIYVVHDTYGCESGCCGHRLEVVGDDALASRLKSEDAWTFSHPYGEDHRRFVRDLVAGALGRKSLRFIDYDACRVSED